MSNNKVSDMVAKNGDIALVELKNITDKRYGRHLFILQFYFLFIYVVYRQQTMKNLANVTYGNDCMLEDKIENLMKHRVFEVW